MEVLRTQATKFKQIEEHNDYHKNAQAEASEKEKEKDKNKSNRPLVVATDRYRQN